MWEADLSQDFLVGDAVYVRCAKKDSNVRTGHRLGALSTKPGPDARTLGTAMSVAASPQRR